MTKPLLFSFEAIADPDAELLILYANRRNAFWKIMAQWLGFDPNASYEARLCELKTARIALWDVLQSCTRVGSLDAKIDADSITVNDFPAFFAKHDRIRAVFFNG
ncbi:MAG: DNA-deoxyinosine glycosylase, partial [Methylococcaceae bacterium]